MDVEIENGLKLFTLLSKYLVLRVSRVFKGKLLFKWKRTDRGVIEARDHLRQVHQDIGRSQGRTKSILWGEEGTKLWQRGRLSCACIRLGLVGLEGLVWTTSDVIKPNGKEDIEGLRWWD